MTSFVLRGWVRVAVRGFGLWFRNDYMRDKKSSHETARW